MGAKGIKPKKYKVLNITGHKGIRLQTLAYVGITGRYAIIEKI
jgi:hypothetical protein